MARVGWTGKTQQQLADKNRNQLNKLVQVGRMVPVPISNLAASSALKTRGSQVSFQVVSLQAVDSFVLLRNFSADIGSAQAIHTWPAASLKSTPQSYPLSLLYMDADPSIAGQKAYYWVRAIPASNATEANVFVSGPQEFDASQEPQASTFTGDLPISQAYTPTTQPLTGTTGVGANQATINVAAFQIQYPFVLGAGSSPALISYNSGSITPLLDATTYYVYFDDPTYAGGAQTYIASTSTPDVTAGSYRQYIGKITTPAHGGGGTGGSGGGGGPCFSPNTLVITKRGPVPIAEITEQDWIYSRKGWKPVAKLLVHEFDGWMFDMGAGELVTPEHRMYLHSKKLKAWVAARDIFAAKVFYTGKVLNIALAGQCRSDDSHCYLLNNNWFAHNQIIK